MNITNYFYEKHIDHKKIKTTISCLLLLVRI